MRNCSKCGKEIPQGRLKALPTTKTCTECSATSKVAGFPVISGKTTYSELAIVSQETYKELTKLDKSKGW